VRARPGLRVPGAWDPYEVGVRAVIGQQVSVAGAGTITARLVERWGTPVPGLGALGLTHLFPPPDVLVTADLDGIGLTGARAAAVRSFAVAVADGSVRLDRSTGLDRLVDSVVALPGLGPWTGHYLALRLGEPDAFPATDLGIRRAVGRLTGSPAPATVADRAEAWRPWRAAAAAHLWLSTT
jgi:AraC family transcriptional regulator of adaptative response / DNA-3-methyladenine glycosylase II